MPALTEEQDLALRTRDVSIALAAGAGCGKTFVLTERFLSHLEPEQLQELKPADLHQLIAITFTDAAAREMRSRIREKCRERLQAAPEDKQEHWLRLLRAIEAAQVSTIHSFCASLLRRHAVAAGLDPSFGVLDQSETSLLESEVIDDVLREKLSAREEDALELAAEYGLAGVKQQIATLLPHRHSAAFKNWLHATPETVVDAWKACYDRDALRIAVSEIASAAPIATLIALLNSAVPENDKFAAARAALLDVLPRLARGQITEADLEAICESARVQNICKPADWPSAELFEEYKSACAKIRDVIKKKKSLDFEESIAREYARLGLALLRLVHHVVEAYEARKAAQNKLDFDDLLALAHGLLTDPRHAAVQNALSSELRLVLVDEFQDTDRLQVDLVKALCGDGFDSGRLFFVGDIKQSIYRFRGAQPDVFHDLRKEVRETGRLPLTLNFRSQPAILNFVNALFEEAFPEEPPLRPSRPQVTDEPAVEFLWHIAPNKNSQVKGAKLEARREEARWIARRLRGLLDSDTQRPIVDETTGQPRKLQLGDVAILFRALSDVQVYEQALRAYGLDYYLVGGHAFYAQQEIYDVLNLLRAIASPADEIALAGALRSPFFSLADETLFWLVEAEGRGQAAGRQRSLNAGLLASTLPAELSPEERAKTAAAAATMRYLRARKDRVSIAELLRDALGRTGYDATLLAEFLGQRKLANLHKLLEQARAADRGGTVDLDGFITQLAEFVTRDPKEALAATSPESADVIRLMTIHQAKGLEFPLVVVPDLDRAPHASSPDAALHGPLGPLVPQPADDDRPRATTGMTLYNALEKIAELEERKRILYVATTRAADYLILSSSLEAFDKPKSDWMELLAARFDLESGQRCARVSRSSCARVSRPRTDPDRRSPDVVHESDPAPAGCDEPLVRVTHEAPPTDFKPVGSSRGPDLLNLLAEAQELAASGHGIVPPEVAPIAVDRAARTQFSFSRLSGQLVRAEMPAVERGSPDPALIDPRDFGSLVHHVLERIDFADSVLRGSPDPALAADGDRVRDWCEQLAPDHVLLNAAAAAREAEQMIARFVASPRGRQLAAASVVHREVEFLLAWPPEDNVDLPPSDSQRYLQGYIDCLYQDAAGDWRLVDYKTNDVPAAAVPHVAKQYEMQLYVYALVIERALGTPPRELVLHFLRPGVEHIVPWNAAARRRAMEMVNEAIAMSLTASDAALPVNAGLVTSVTNT